MCVCVVGGWWASGKVGSLSFQKGLRTKQETIPLFWLVVATSVWNFEEVEFTCYVHVCAQVRACTHKHKHHPRITLIFTHSAGNVWHASISRGTKTA